MTYPTFPTLAGQGFSVRKKPAFSTIVASHVSGREVRDALYLNPIWNFELTFDGLDGTGAGAYGGLGAGSLQQLMGLFLQCQGQYGAFVFYDPTDYAVSAQAFGVGDGTTTAFQLTRTLGGYAEPVVAPFSPAAPTAFQPQPGAASLYAPNNQILYSDNFASAAWQKLAGGTGAVPALTTGQTDPFGGATAASIAFSLGATPATASSRIYQGAASAPFPAVNSIYLKSGDGAAHTIYLSGGAVGALINVTTSWQRFSVASTASAYSQIQFGLSGAGGAGGVATDVSATIVAAAPQVEATVTQTAPGPYNPTTFGAAYNGGPRIYAGGVLQNPTGYALSNPGGVVTFNAAPASGAQLTWSGFFGFLCRFDGDDLDFEQFMANLWKAESVKFRSLRAQ